MALELHENIDGLLVSLRGLVHVTEEIYVGMGRTYPSLLSSLQHGMDDSNRIFRSSSEKGTESVQSTFSSIFQFINEGNNNLREMSQEDRILHENLQQRLKDIQNLDRHIVQIKEDSGAMELISLNAMTVALKAGTHGRAFSIITEELKRLSTRTMELTDRLTARGKKVTGSFQIFQGELAKLEDTERAVVDGFIANSSQCMERIQLSLSGVDGLLGQIQESGSRISASLVRLISSIQSQDIIRQSIDHIMMALSEMKTINNQQTTESLLDTLSFHEQLPALCILVMEDVRSINQKSREALAEALASIRREATRLDSTLSRIHEMAGDSANEKSIRHAFDCSNNLFRDLVSQLQSLSREKTNSVNYSQELEMEVRELDEDFRSFGSIITRFQTVDISSRIEIAKQHVLQEMSSTVDEMTDLTEHIRNDVESATGITGSFLKDTHAYLGSYRKSNAKRGRTVRDFIKGIEKRTRQFQRVEEDLMASFQGSGQALSGFRFQFETSDKDLDRLDHLNREMDALIHLFEKIRVYIGNQKRKIMDEHGVKEWQIHNHKLTTMINQFTILTHKKAAAKIGGFEVEEGTASGDITLF